MLLELYPNAALDIWDRFDHLFIEDLITETIELRKLEEDKDNVNEVSDEQKQAVQELYNSDIVTSSGKTLAQLANFE